MDHELITGAAGLRGVIRRPQLNILIILGTCVQLQIGRYTKAGCLTQSVKILGLCTASTVVRHSLRTRYYSRAGCRLDFRGISSLSACLRCSHSTPAILHRPRAVEDPFRVG